MKSINLQRTESLLMELIPQALSQLQNSKINSLPITGVNCKNGKYDAIVYFDGSDFDKDEVKEVIESKKANGRIKVMYWQVRDGINVQILNLNLIHL